MSDNNKLNKKHPQKYKYEGRQWYGDYHELTLQRQTAEAVKKYGSKDSGGVLGEILGPFLKKKQEDKKK